MSIVWRKVWRDLWGNKARTLLVVLSIAVGVFAMGLIFGSYSTMRVRMLEDYQAAHPAPVLIWGVPVDEAVVDAVLREPGVADAESRVQTSFHWKLEGETDWRNGSLFARVDYEAQRIGSIDLLDGQWPAKRTLAVERESSRHFDIPLGTSIVVEYGRREIGRLDYLAQILAADQFFLDDLAHAPRQLGAPLGDQATKPQAQYPYLAPRPKEHPDRHPIGRPTNRGADHRPDGIFPAP